MRTATWLAIGGMACAAAAAEPLRVAVLVGIRHYDKPGFPELPATEADVAAMATELRALKFDRVEVYTSAEGPGRATLANLRKGLAAAARGLTKRDVMLLHLAGHGQQLAVKDGDREIVRDFFCPVDGVSLDPETLWPLDEALGVLAANVGSGLVIADACRNTPDDPSRAAACTKVKLRASGIQGRTMTLPPGMSIMFSCAEGQTALELEKSGHGLFTQCLLEELRQAKGEIAWTPLAGAVETRMASAAVQAILGKHQQTPVLAGNLRRVSLGRRPEAALTMTPPIARTVPARDPPQAVPNSLGMAMVRLPEGDFTMGDDNLPAGAAREHRVSVKSFWLARHETTVGEYRKFAAATGRPLHEKNRSADAALPVAWVGHEDAVAFCEWLGQREGKKYRLPTEAEWEYACRAGSAGKYCFGDDDGELKQHAVVGDVFKGPEPVGKRKPNAFGLCDMHGNVAEWCQDWYSADAYMFPTPGGPENGEERVIRGGCWRSAAGYCGSAVRGKQAPAKRNAYTGFRVAYDDG